MDKRDIRPEELAWVFSMAQKYDDLRKIGEELSELAHLRERVRHLDALVKSTVQPKSISDLLKLEKAGILTKQGVASKIGEQLPPRTAEQDQAVADFRNGKRWNWARRRWE